MAKLLDKPFRAETALNKITGDVKLSEVRRRWLSLQAARQVINSGGVTDSSTFLFAMYGVHPDYPQNEQEARIAERHHALLDQFRNLESGTPVAKVLSADPSPFNMIFLAGTTPAALDHDPPLRFTIQRDPYWNTFSYRSYRHHAKFARGAISLPVDNYHHWGPKGALNRSDKGRLVLFEAGRTLTGKHTSSTPAANYLIGLENIRAAHQLGQEGHHARDAEFLGRMAVFTQNIAD